MCPEQWIRDLGVITPDSSAAKATIILNVEPGGYWPEIDLLIKGFLGWFDNISQSEADIPGSNLFGSKVGAEAETKTSPELTSITTTEPDSGKT